MHFSNLLFQALICTSRANSLGRAAGGYREGGNAYFNNLAN